MKARPGFALPNAPQRGAAGFPALNRGYNAVFRPQQLSVGLVAPLESYPRTAVPAMTSHLERAELADRLGFAALWLRDVPFVVPSFGDAGQVYDPFVYLGYLAARTEGIALGVASVVLPLRHPAHVAKAAASVDALSGGRLILGVASGDRPAEYPALGVPYNERGARFRAAFETLEQLAQPWPRHESLYGRLDGDLDVIPKPIAGKVPLLITGGSRQSPEWVAAHGDGWMTYPRDAASQGTLLRDWRARVEAAGGAAKPALEPLYLDLADDPGARPTPIHLGFRMGLDALRDYLSEREAIGVNHVALNLRFNQADFETTLNRLADEILPAFTPAEAA